MESLLNHLGNIIVFCSIVCACFATSVVSICDPLDGSLSDSTVY